MTDRLYACFFTAMYQEMMCMRYGRNTLKILRGGMRMNDWERLSRQAEDIKRRYPKGTKVRLGHMEGEGDMPSGLRGTVILVDDIGQIHVKWENGRSLPLNVEADSFQVVDRPKKERGMPSR